MSKQQRFETLMGQLSVNYRRDVTAAETANFRLMIQRWGFDAFEKAAHDHMFDPDQGQYFPSIANISKHVTGTTKQQQQSIEDKIETAWATIYRKIGSVGPYFPLKMEDKLALEAVKSIGGWASLCSKSEQELTWLKKEFASVYDTFDRTPVDQLPHDLPGLPEIKKHKAEQGAKLSGLLSEVQRRSEPAKALPASTEVAAKGIQDIRKAAGQPTQQEQKPSKPAATKSEIEQALADCEFRKQARDELILKGIGDDE